MGTRRPLSMARPLSRQAQTLGALAALALLAGCGHLHVGAHDWVVFASDRDGRWDVYASHPDGQGLIRVSVRHDEMPPQLAASPDGSKLAIVRSGGTTIIDDGGRRLRQPGGDMYAQPYVTAAGKVHLATGDGVPSPDGVRVALVDRQGRLWIKTKNGAARRLVARLVEPAQILWSPNGRLLAFPIARGQRGPHNPIYQVAVVRADGSGLRVLTRSSTEEDAYPNAWSPDSRRLLFVRGYPPQALEQVWSAAPDGSEARSLTRAYPAGGENIRPVWFRGVLHGVAAPGPLYRVAGRVLRTRYLVGEVGAANGQVAVLPLPHDPQTPRPSFPFLFWTPATGMVTTRPIPACARPEGLVVSGSTAVFDCNNSCCDSSDESLFLFRAGQPALSEAADGEGSGGEGGTFLRGYGLDGDSLVYGRSLEFRTQVRAGIWRLEGGRRMQVGPLVGNVVGYADDRIAVMRRGELEVLDRTGRGLYRLSLPGLRATPEDGHFHSPSAEILLGSVFGVAIQGQRLIIWDAANGRLRRSRPVAPGAALDALSGRRAALVSGRSVYVVDLDSGRSIAFHFPAVVISPVGKGTTAGFYARTPVRVSLDGDRLAVAYNVSVGGVQPGRVVLFKLPARLGHS
jgi:hypothetical protein